MTKSPPPFKVVSEKSLQLPKAELCQAQYDTHKFYLTSIIGTAQPSLVIFDYFMT